MFGESFQSLFCGVISCMKMAMRSNRNCCIVGCHTTAGKCRGLSFLSIPKAGKNSEMNKWRSDLIQAINRCDTSFNADKALICSRHFDENCLKRGPTGRCTGLVPGSMPLHWMPRKSIETSKTMRPEPTAREPPPVPVRICYRTFEDVQTDARKSLPPGWVMMESTLSSLQIGLPSEKNQWRIVVSMGTPHLLASVKVIGIPAAHLGADLEGKKLCAFLRELQAMDVCTGITSAPLQQFAGPPDSKTSYYQHIQYLVVNGVMQHTSCVRSIHCQLLYQPDNKGEWCRPCQQAEALLMEKKKRHESRMMQPLKPNDSLRSLHNSQLKEALKHARREKNTLQKELEKFKAKLANDSVELSEDLHCDLQHGVMGNLNNPLQKLFWEEQQKAFLTKEHGMRWHPMMIRLAILIHSKSESAYETLRKTGILKLPGKSTLREYTSAVHPQQGFQPEVLEELKRTAERLPANQRFVVLLHDEMSIKSDLVFDNRMGELVGFINSKDEWDFECRPKKLASHVLVFYVVGVNSTLKMSMGLFPTRTATSDQLYFLFWNAVGHLEDAGLKVIISTSDKAPANQRLYQMHARQEDICFKTRNNFASDRWIYFISDPPHLIKTVRNNLVSSAEGATTRLLWKDGEYMLWRHIADLYHADMQRGLARTRLTLQHVHLSPHSVMNVRLAAQALSERVGRIMQQFGGPDRQETAKFILHMDRFFDCLNSRHLLEAERKRKPDLSAYTQLDDPRFNYLQTEFLQFLEEWRSSVENRPGPFTRAERAKMFLSFQTYRGLVMTVHGFVEATKFLLANGVEFVLSNMFCQDPIEEHFGRHRAMGRTAENPNLLRFAYQENSIRLQRQLALTITPQGNVRGNNHQRPPVTISSSPLKKKPRNN